MKHKLLDQKQIPGLGLKVKNRIQEFGGTLEQLSGVERLSSGMEGLSSGMERLSGLS